MSNLLERKVSILSLVYGICASMVLTFCLTAAQPNMESALAALRNARKSLIAATPDKGGHRANAIKLVDSAISEVQEGIALH